MWVPYGSVVDDIQDPRRTEPPFVLDEREMLEGWLEFHRMTLILKCEGLDDAARKRRPIATSLLSLHGLVRHMAEVERSWFRRRFGSDPNLPHIFLDPAIEDSELAPLDDASWDDDLAAWHAACDASRAAAEGHALDESVLLPNGKQLSLRWIYNHMIEEYARHNGHADLIREMVDGAVGW
jgi:uncharacterized damage-inducible protein DinB